MSWKRKPDPEMKGHYCYESGGLRISPVVGSGNFRLVQSEDGRPWHYEGLPIGRPSWWYVERISDDEIVADARTLKLAKQAAESILRGAGAP